MKRLLKLGVGAVLVSMVLTLLVAGGVFAGTGPAPSSGDCDPDGSGFEHPMVPNASGSGTGPVGPAPDSGDGVPDGSGFED